MDTQSLTPASFLARSLGAAGFQSPRRTSARYFGGSNELEVTVLEVLRATRSWIQLCTFGFAVTCIVIGAVESLFGK